MKQCLLLILLLCLASCSVKRPSEVLPDSKMEEVLYDYHVAKAMGDEMGRQEAYKRVLFTEAVFKKHGITKADFDTSMVWFSRNPEVLTKIYERVNLRLKAERDGVNSLIALREEKPKEFLSGDSVDVWTGKAFYRLNGTPLNNKITFKFPADTTFHDRDTLRWSVRFRFLEGEVDTLAFPLMAMQVKYEKQDSVTGNFQRIESDGVQILTLFADTLGSIKEVRGFIYFPHPTPSRSLWADHITLMRYHAKDSLVIASPDSLQRPTSPIAKDSIKQPADPKQTGQPAEKQPRPVRPRPRA